MNDIIKIDYIIRVETNEENHSMIEKLTESLVNIIKQNETEVEYIKHWYLESNNGN